jgi:hypothetical protein
MRDASQVFQIVKNRNNYSLVISGWGKQSGGVMADVPSNSDWMIGWYQYLITTGSNPVLTTKNIK